MVHSFIGLVINIDRYCIRAHLVEPAVQGKGAVSAVFLHQEPVAGMDDQARIGDAGPFRESPYFFGNGISDDWIDFSFVATDRKPRSARTLIVPRSTFQFGVTI
jgi:hypothetical protein